MAAAEPSAQALEVDEWTRDDDQDSTYTASIASSSESLASSIFRHRQENGRTYHAFKEGKYVLPNDQHKQRVFPNTQRAGNNTQETYDADYGTPPNAQNENDRLDLQHTLFRITFGDKLFVSPGGGRGSPHRVLDAGTRTGIWAVDYADENPEAEVVGVDLSAIQPDFVPVNLSFFIDDLEDPWTFNTKFDFIYGRMLTGSLRDWPKFIQQSYDNLESGGWLEIADILLDFSTDDNTIPADSPASKWGRLMLEAADKFGAPLDSCKRYKEQLVEAGFVDVVQEVYKWPSYVWPKDPKFKEMGMWTYENLGNGASGLSLALFTRALGWTAEEVEIFLVDVRNDMKNLSVHAWWPIYVVYGRKP